MNTSQKGISQVLQEAIRTPIVLIASLLGFFLIWFIILIIPNTSFILNSFFSPSYTGTEKLQIFFSVLRSFDDRLSVPDQIAVWILSFLSAINIGLFTQYVGKKISADQTHHIGLFGTILSLLGVGCASCGSALLSSLIGITATAQLLSFFPLHGAEFSLLGAAFLLYSIVTLFRKIQKRNDCGLQRNKKRRRADTRHKKTSS